MRGKEGMSFAWLPARGLREGCSTSPILFNIYHQAVLRQAGEARAAAWVSEVRVEWRWMPGSFGCGDNDMGSWVGTKEDVNMLLRRVGGMWAKVKEQLNNTRLSKRRQARIVQPCVESALLFDCQARVWWKKEVMRLQKWMDKCRRYVWSNRNGEPLRQMQDGDGGGVADGVGRVGGGVGKRVSFQFCGRVVNVRNIARHLCQSCRV